MRGEIEDRSRKRYAFIGPLDRNNARIKFQEPRTKALVV